MISIEQKRCKGCGLCAFYCPKKIITLSEEVNPKGYHFAIVSHLDSCINCKQCILICPEGIINETK